MKSLFFSMFLLFSILLVLARLNDAAVQCGTVTTKAASCAMYAMGKDATPSGACCTGLQQLASTVKSVDDKRAMCRCLKAGVKNLPGVQDKFLSKIPSACHINVNFPVSLSVNCDTIK